MTDDLRTRIISALLSEDDVALMADAVIRELGLKLQREEDGDEEPRGLFTQHRYVTDWKTDE